MKWNTHSEIDVFYLTVDDHCKLSLLACDTVLPILETTTSMWGREKGGWVGVGGGGYICGSQVGRWGFVQPRFGKYFIKTILVK